MGVKKNKGIKQKKLGKISMIKKLRLLEGAMRTILHRVFLAEKLLRITRLLMKKFILLKKKITKIEIFPPN